MVPPARDLALHGHTDQRPGAHHRVPNGRGDAPRQMVLQLRAEHSLEGDGAGVGKQDVALGADRESVGQLLLALDQ
ncbi:MAG: hypothetical protein AUH78_06925 [Gemmatimonadetes bacterium 13_1_40CM_4_69_8]|nr:MAG: hypothetical protein AUH78_06925 [Gemmatimonadetes bacterium 13_1_40CM_4_69_8]